jgi:uncharacterized membrane protein YeiH
MLESLKATLWRSEFYLPPIFDFIAVSFFAIGLGAYSVVGVQKSVAAVFVGVTNACGGGLLRDIITREEPLMLKPGQFYVLASLLGSAIFVTLMRRTEMWAPVAALIAMTLTLLFRVQAIAFNWRTAPVQPWRCRRRQGLAGPSHRQPQVIPG